MFRNYSSSYPASYKTSFEIHLSVTDSGCYGDPKSPGRCVTTFAELSTWAFEVHHQFSNIRGTQSPYINISRLVLRLSLPNPLKPGIKLRIEDVVGAAPTGAAPTTSEWSTISLPSNVRFILETLWYLIFVDGNGIPYLMAYFVLGNYHLISDTNLTADTLPWRHHPWIYNLT